MAIWEEIIKKEKQREEKYKDLVEVKEQGNERWFVFCKKHGKTISPFSAFLTNSYLEQIDKGLESCHGATLNKI